MSVGVAQQCGIEILFEAIDATEASNLKATPHDNSVGLLVGSDDYLFHGSFQTRPFI